MRKVFGLAFLLSLYTFLGFAQSVEEKLVAHKWALTSYVEVEGIQFDTLFKAFDCENGAYIKFNSEQKFEERDKKGAWEIVADSILHFKNGLGIAYKKSRIAVLTDDELVLIDNNKGKGIFYIENYKKCTGGELEVLDTRTAVDVIKTLQLSVGAQFSESVTFTGGFSQLKSDWKKRNTYYNGEFHFNPSDEFYGLAFNAFSSDLLLYGAGISAYTDSDDVQIGLQPTIGITGKPLGGFGEGVQLYYTLIIPFIGEEIGVVPTHNVGLRINFPVRSKTKQVRRINVGEGL